MIRLAYSTNAYTRYSLEEAISDVRAAGFAGVEILADVPHLKADDGPAAWERARRALGGLAVSNLNANTARALDPSGRDPGGFWPSLAERDADMRWARRVYVEKCVEAAAHLGAPCVSIATAPAERFPRPGEAMTTLLGEIDVLARVCARHGVRLGIEFEPGHLVGSAAQMCDLLAALDSPLVGVNLDIGHVVCAGEDPAEAVRALRGRIWNVHLEDIRGRIHEHLIPGEGDVDFRAVFSALEETGYDGFVTLELYPYADDPGGAGRRALEHLRARLG